jgi:hypothetical protein
LLPRLFVLLTLLPVLAPTAAIADVVEGLYQATVTVEDHGDRQLAIATRAGLGQVFIKVSGSAGILDDPEVFDALGRAQSFMQQYQYRRAERDTLELEIQFDQQLVNDVLTQALLPLWSANRPPVLVWLVVDDAHGRNVASGEAYADLLAAVRTEFMRRGVPVEFPLYDLQDTLAVSVHDLWQMDSLAVYGASRRYSRDDVLIGRLRETAGDRWMGDWLYLFHNESRSVTGYGESLDKFVASGVYVVSESMAARYAVSPTGSAGEGILVRVDGLGSFADYRASQDYLEAVELVDAAIAEYVAGDTVVFRVAAQLETLQQLIASKRRLELQQQFQQLDGDHPAAALVYRWNP